MKYIGIITATDEEITAIKSKFTNLKENKVKFLKCWEGIFNNKNYILVKAGVGKVNAATTTQVLIDNYNMDYVINIGAAGSINNDLNIADIVIGEKLVQHDFDTTALGDEKGYITDTGKYFESDKELIDKCKKYLVEENINGIVGTIATGDKFCTSYEIKNRIKQDFNAECVEMEGASIAQTCKLNNVPFLVIRSISDKLNGENQIEYNKFAKIAAENCANFVLKI